MLIDGARAGFKAPLLRQAAVMALGHVGSCASGLRLLQEVKHLRSMLRERDAELHRSVQETTALKVRLAEAGLDTIDVGTPRGTAEPAAITKKSRSWFSPK